MDALNREASLQRILNESTDAHGDDHHPTCPACGVQGYPVVIR